MKIVDQTLLNELFVTSSNNERKRINYNLHPQLDDPVQRLLNVMQPGTYVRPHRHPEAGKWEVFLCVKGGGVACVFSDEGKLLDRIALSSMGPNYLIEIPPNTWHAITATEVDSVFFEVKPGPYVPHVVDGVAVWSPEEGTREVAGFLHWMLNGEINSQAPGYHHVQEG